MQRAKERRLRRMNHGRKAAVIEGKTAEDALMVDQWQRSLLDMKRLCVYVSETLKAPCAVCRGAVATFRAAPIAGQAPIPGRRDRVIEH